MITKITGEQPFQVLTNNFSISPSSEGYTLQISADGTNFSNLFTVGAGVTRLVTGVAANSYYRLSGNQSKVSINWMKTCVTGGEGGAGNELTPVTEFPLNADPGDVVALVSGDTMGVYQYDGENWNEVGGNTEDIELPIAAAVNDLKDNIEARLNQKYYTRQEVNDIAARKTEPGQVNVQIQDYVVPAIAEVNSTIEDKELATSAAINDLNTATVKSSVVKNIWSGTQSEYDAIVTKDPATLYIIKD